MSMSFDLWVVGVVFAAFKINWLAWTNGTRLPIVLYTEERSPLFELFLDASKNEYAESRVNNSLNKASRPSIRVSVEI